MGAELPTAVDVDAITIHEAANMFPRLEGPEFQALVDDIRENGLRKPILLLDGKVVDGRNRLHGCYAAGVEPRFEDVQTDDPVRLVLSLNLGIRAPGAR